MPKPLTPRLPTPRQPCSASLVQFQNLLQSISREYEALHEQHRNATQQVKDLRRLLSSQGHHVHELVDWWQHDVLQEVHVCDVAPRLVTTPGRPCVLVTSTPRTPFAVKTSAYLGNGIHVTSSPRTPISHKAPAQEGNGHAAQADALVARNGHVPSDASSRGVFEDGSEMLAPVKYGSEGKNSTSNRLQVTSSIRNSEPTKQNSGMLVNPQPSDQEVKRLASLGSFLSVNAESFIPPAISATMSGAASKKQRPEPDEENCTKSRIAQSQSLFTAGHDELKDRYMSAFDSLDPNEEGRIDQEALRHALRSMGESPVRARKLMASIDKNGDGIVDRKEWENAVEEIMAGVRQKDVAFLTNFIKKIDRRGGTGLAANSEKAAAIKEYCLIPYRSKFRVCWDMFLGVLLMQVALVIPVEIGFLSGTHSPGLMTVGLVIDLFFLFDVVLNFRTTYRDRSYNHVTSGSRIACHYLRTWFLIDLVSSIPLEYVSSGFLPSMNMTKLAKSGKAIKLLKMLRFTKASRFSERISDYIAVSGGTLLWGLALVSAMVVMLCHWLACMLPLVGDGFLSAYEHVGTTVASRYCSAVYWAVTTITTVGYGDVLPTTDAERLYTIASMLVGGALYSCVIGNVFVLLNNRNLQAQTCIQRMREVLTFLDHHDLPKQLRHRVWHYHRKHLKNRAAHDTFSVLGDLAPELRQAVSFCIVHEDVRSNPLFSDLPSIVILFLASVMKNIHADRGDVIVTLGDFGYAMSVIIEGSAVIGIGNKPIKSSEEAMALCNKPMSSQLMLPGDSFGEEILLGAAKNYAYSIVGVDKSTLSQIPVEEFMMQFQSMPDILQRMRANFNEHGSLYSGLMNSKPN